MATKTKQLSGVVTLDLDLRPDLPGDKDRLLLAVETLTVMDEATFQRAADLRETAQQRLKTISSSKLAGAKKMAHDSWKSICEVLNDLSAPFEKVVAMADSKMKTWRLEEDRKARENALALESAQEDVKVDLAEQARLARRNGDIATARALEQQMQEVAVVEVAPSVKPEVENLTERRTWIGVCDKPMELIAAVSEGRCALIHTITVRGEVREEPLLIVNPAVVLFYAKKLERELPKILPGCHAEQDLSFAGKRS